MDDIPLYRAKTVKHAYFSHWALLLGPCFTLAYQASILLCVCSSLISSSSKSYLFLHPIAVSISPSQQNKSSTFISFAFSHLNLFPCLRPSSPQASIFLSRYQSGILFSREAMVKLLWSQLQQEGV